MTAYCQNISLNIFLKIFLKEKSVPLLAKQVIWRDETGVGGLDARPARPHGLVGDGELTQTGPIISDLISTRVNVDTHHVAGCSCLAGASSSPLASLWLVTPDRIHTGRALAAQRSVQQLVMVYVTVGDLAEDPLPLPLHLRQLVSY